ncbi:hypothetical protein CRENPOLYSF1_580020 [Crenothrix polyspora]|uniref:Uncharacterized protein n=1 Tax=Crenothrix polyspora TaxID=360316 RepID=A0A1R4HEQ4_9GAMM|nr:hypothetical protein CRENPOLYSF1_580020 [Crenothrix polyspora]
MQAVAVMHGMFFLAMGMTTGAINTVTISLDWYATHSPFWINQCFNYCGYFRKLTV